MHDDFIEYTHFKGSPVSLSAWHHNSYNLGITICKELAWVTDVIADKVIKMVDEIILTKFSMDKRQCQIRVRFESGGMQFFKVLGKWFSMTKYLPIIVLWCSERGFYKKNHLITCFKRFYRCPTSLGSVHTYDRVSWCRNIIKSFQYSLRIFVCYAN